MSLIHTLLPVTLLVTSLHEPPRKISHNAICLFSARQNDPLIVQEEAMLDADIPGMAKRDLLLSIVTPKSDPGYYQKMVTPGASFTLVLIDANGNTRLKSSRLVSREALYAVIDGKEKPAVPAHQLDKGIRQ